MVTMRKQLVAIGNSTGIILDRPILELLHIEPGGEVDLRIEGTTLLLTAAKGRRTVKESYERVAKRHRASFAKLAK